MIAAKLGRAQKAVILSLSKKWGPASDHRCARRMFYGVGETGAILIFHKRNTDNEWMLSTLGAAVQAELLREPEKVAA